MKLNYETCIVGTKCVLVPYRPCHVTKYHEWMQQSFLLEMTGSEPLSLDEEVAMQQTWRDDDHKCTFIILARDQCHFQPPQQQEDDNNQVVPTTREDPDFCPCNLHAMVGDVNLFFSEEDPDDDHANDDDHVTSKPPQQPHQLQAELDIMIAEADYRGKGIGKEASCLMMLYGVKIKNIRRFFCKIKETNHASINLFETKLKFQQCGYAACFQEVELELRHESADSMTTHLQDLLGGDANVSSWNTFQCPVVTTNDNDNHDC